jgi:cytochrome b6-f complex subunit 8
VPWAEYSAATVVLLAMLITLGWAALAATFSFSIAMVVWGRNGDNTLNF